MIACHCVIPSPDNFFLINLKTIICPDLHESLFHSIKLSSMKNPLIALFLSASLWCMSVPAFSQAETTSNLVFILDGSGSMWQKIEGDYKISIAKNVLKKLVEGLPADTKIGLVAYGHRQKSDCGDIETLLSLAQLNKPYFLSTLEAINPHGMTPIARSIRHTLELIKDEKVPISVILVSDGLETCEGNACEIVKAAKAQGVSITMHVVGFAIGEKDQSALECIAQAGGGQYLPAENAAQLQDALEQTVQSPVKGGGNLSVKATIGQSLTDVTIKIYQPGHTNAIVSGRTYKSPETNPRLLSLPPGTYDLEVISIELDGSPSQKLNGVVITAEDTLFKHFDFSFGSAEVLVTRNGALSDGHISFFPVGSNKATVTGRSYRSASSNPAKYQILPGTYDVEIVSIEIESRPSFRLSNQVVNGGATLSLSHEFKSGILKIGAKKGSEYVDAVVTIRDKKTGKSVANGRTYSTAQSNPASYVVEPGNYVVDIKPVKPKDLPPKKLELSLKAGEEIEQIVNY